MVKDLGDYLTNAWKICKAEKRHVEELQRLVWQCKETCGWLSIWQRKFSGPSPYASLTFGQTLFDSYDELHRRASEIKHFLTLVETHNEGHFHLDLIWHTQWLLDVAAEKVAFIEDCDKFMQRQRRALARIQPIIKDKVTKFYIALACDKPAL